MISKIEYFVYASFISLFFICAGNSSCNEKYKKEDSEMNFIELNESIDCINYVTFLYPGEYLFRFSYSGHCSTPSLIKDYSLFLTKFKDSVDNKDGLGLIEFNPDWHVSNNQRDSIILLSENMLNSDVQIVETDNGLILLKIVDRTNRSVR